MSKAAQQVIPIPSTPSGLCQCGCGQSAPKRFLRGHNNIFRPNPFVHRADGTTALTLERRNGTRVECVLDTADYDLVKTYRWWVAAPKEKRTSYAVASGAKIPHQKRRPPLRMHKVLFPDSEEIDHIDHNGLNNRRSNLRAATSSQNKMNRRKRSDASSAFLGVSFSGQKWRAQIIACGQKYELGLFNSEIEAACARDAKAKEIHGPFAVLNFPQSLS